MASSWRSFAIQRRGQSVHKLIAIMMREYRDVVKKKSFVVGTVLSPFIMAALVFLPALLAGSADSEKARFAILDVEAGKADRFISVLTDTLPDPLSVYDISLCRSTAEDAEAAMIRLDSLVRADSIAFYMVIDSSLLSSETAKYHGKSLGDVTKFRRLERALTRVVMEQRLQAFGVSPDSSGNLIADVELQFVKLGERQSGMSSKERFLSEYLGSLVFVMVMFGTIIGYGQQLLRVVLEEKSSRVVETLVSSVTPFQLMMGKILGLASATIVQLLIWAAMALILTVGFGDAGFVKQGLSSISPLFLVMFAVYMILGYLLYSSIFAIIGAAVTTDREAQQFMFPIVMALMLPALIQFMITRSPNSMLIKILSFIPFFTPTMMISRMRATPPSGMELALSVAILVVSIIAMGWVAAKVFRVGILMYGKRATFPEVMRWIREK